MKVINYVLVSMVFSGVFISRASAQEIITTPIFPSTDLTFLGPLPKIPKPLVNDPYDLGTGGVTIQPAPANMKEQGWKYYPPFESHPPIPAQSSFSLTDQDPLVISVPMFDYGGSSLGLFSTNYRREGDHIYLDGYFLHSLVMTATIHGPRDYYRCIEPLEPGNYTLHVRHFYAVDSQLRDFEAFKADPVKYMEFLKGTDSFWSTLNIAQATQNFTVVPEPNAVILFGMAIGTVTLAGFIKRRQFQRS